MDDISDDGEHIETEGGNQQEFEPKNQDPEFAVGLVNTGIFYLQQYGWFIVLGILVLLYIKRKLDPSIRKMKAKAEDISYQKKFDPDTAQKRLEAMERARIKLQEENDAKTAKYAEQQKLKEEEKRKQKIEDWDKHQEGKGYRSKYKPKEDTSDSDSKKFKPNPRLRQSDYNPLMGGGGSGYRPPRRGGGG